ncbi:uncharacterized protein LOC100485511 [Xenopus tropicalis]|uniref:Uncharacterized protein LOC100485511 n=1 Tax=Xenopus tropicalis TaxID=8364 RepID=A0A1B8Y1L1_XENTR|nr:uncharacterized protein LOC100485511 [Xenopus tropicalis]|eukprot:XP_002942960.1 PREDICTED: uncharacterized protein LOC100485511 [Xenopus tropicalis]
MAHSRQSIGIPAPDPDKAPANEDQAGNPQTRTMAADRSDFFPSVSLAGVLLIVFLLVIPVLFPSVHPLGSHSIPVNGTFVQLHPLLTSQPLSTRWALQKIFRGIRIEGITVIAVAQDDAVQTLVCFSSYLISLLSHKSTTDNVTKSLRHTDLQARNSAGTQEGFYVSVITQEKGQSPYGVILGPGTSKAGGGLQWEMSLTLKQMDNEQTMLKEALFLAGELLQILQKTGQVPQTFGKTEFWGKKFPVLRITGNPYLESGYVC